MLINSDGWKKLVNKEKFKLNKKKLIKIKNQVLKNYNEFAFLKKNDDKYLFKSLTEAKNKLEKLEKIILVGTGGSSLGAKAFLSVINDNRIVFLENIDPKTIKNTFEKIIGKSIGLLIISKSGETLEVLSIFDIIINNLKKQINIKKNVIVITDDQNSKLKNISETYKIKLFPHDKNIGGRYSCFSITGLLPLHLAGIDAKKIKKLANVFFDNNLIQDKYNVFKSVNILSIIIKQKKYVGHVFLTYLDSFNQLSKWYRQLWAESLGKNKFGLQLITASGPVDQHSQLQMWLDGPKNLLFTIVIPKKRTEKFIIKDLNNLLPNYLKKKDISNILNTMAEATAKELSKAGIPVRVIYLEDDTINSAVKIMTTLMLEVSLLSKLIGVNPFDQPSVEKTKNRTKKMLENYGRN